MKLETRTANIHDELIEACRRNDRKAQLQLYKNYYKAMYNTAFRILRNSAEAEDVMQEAFLAAFKKIDEYKGDASFGAWLKRIVVNKSLDELKKKKELVSIDEKEILIEDNGQEENYLEILSYKIEQIRQGIEELADDDRVIISLFLLEGYDHEEIAQVLNISYGASRTRYSRARQKLREMLGRESIDKFVN